MAVAAEPMAQEKNFLGEGRFLIANKATLVGTIGVKMLPSRNPPSRCCRSPPAR